MILVTGGSGFIGSNIVGALNQKGIRDILVSDMPDTTDKWKNLAGKNIADYIDKDKLLEQIEGHNLDTVIHMGACTDTMTHDAKQMLEDNHEYSKKLWRHCVKKRIKFIYASSASVYGDGSSGFRESIPFENLKPLNIYAYSKQLFDQWVHTQKETPPCWAGLRFFNVYGPGEYHKGSMASMILHAYNQIKNHGKVSLFKSYNTNYEHGEQQRDFIYVKDAANVVLFLYSQSSFPSGFYNVGTGHSYSFNELAWAVFAALKCPIQIEYAEMPQELQSQYQYFTKADLSKLRMIGYTQPFTAMYKGIEEYIACLKSGTG